MKTKILNFVSNSWTELKIKLSFKSDKEPEKCSGPVEYEEAISATGFGKFNFLLLAFIVPAAVGSISTTTTMSYAMPSAECDLGLSLLDKGLMNAVPHIGMIFSSLFVGYLADTLGRKKIMVVAYLLDGICNLMASISHIFWLTITFKFFAGFFLCGAHTVLLSSMAEFHSSSSRPAVVMYMGLCYALGNLVLPGLAWLMLVQPQDYQITETYTFHGWQLYMLLCSLPTILSGSLALLIPESPRFLASRGRTEEALQVLKKLYAVNTGLHPDSYPVKVLKSFRESDVRKDDSNPDKEDAGYVEPQPKETAKEALRGGVKQIRPLFHSPHLISFLILTIIEFGTMLGCNTLRLWLPELFKMMSMSTVEDASLCDMIHIGNDTSVIDAVKPESGQCEPIHISNDAFINSIIVASVQVTLCTVAGGIINIVGKRRLLGSVLILGGAAALVMFWSESAEEARFLAAISVACSAIGTNALLSVVVDLFPTALRATAVSLILMVGRIGSISGNLTFPLLLASGCLPPFITLATILASCGLLSIWIPRPKDNVITS